MTGLPAGVVVRLRHDTHVAEGGRTLVGGAPTRVLFLTPAAQAMMTGDELHVTDPLSRALAERLLDAGLADPVLATLPESTVPPEAVTFVIPAYGRADGLERLLASIPPRHPVIVVDDASPLPGPIARAAARHGARLVVLGLNRGPAGARNAGLAEVATPYVVFVDDDVVVDDRVVPALLRHFVDPRLAVAAPRVLGLRNGADTNWIGRYEAARSSLDLGPRGGAVRARSPISWVPATFLLARVDALGAGFASDMREGEDVDLVWRLVRDGWHVRYEPAAHVWHDHRTTVRGWLSRKAFYGSSAHALQVRHGTLIAPAVFAPWSLAVMGILLAQRRWSAAAGLAAAGVATVRIAGRLGASAQPYRTAARLTTLGVGAAASQTMALLVRHWWPLTVVVAPFSRRIARAAVVAAVADAAVDYVRLRPDLDPVRFAVARRLDDLGYGWGVWQGALRGRSVRALLPDIVWRARHRPTTSRPARAARGQAAPPSRSGGSVRMVPCETGRHVRNPAHDAR